jgi:hypothetical protein
MNESGIPRRPQLLQAIEFIRKQRRDVARFADIIDSGPPCRMA